MYLCIWKGDRLDKKFTLDLKDINELPGIDYEVSIVGDIAQLCIGLWFALQTKSVTSHFQHSIVNYTAVYLLVLIFFKSGTFGWNWHESRW